MAQITKNGKVIWRGGSELDAMKDANQMSRFDMRHAYTVTTDRGKPLIQYGPNDQVSRSCVPTEENGLRFLKWGMRAG